MKAPRDIVAIIVVSNGREKRLDLEGHSPELRLAHLQDAVQRWVDEWAAHHLRLPVSMVEAMRLYHERLEETAIQKRSAAGKLTAKKLKERARSHRAAILAAHRAGYPAHIELRNRVSYIATKTKLSTTTVRKHLPGLKKRKSASK